MVHSIRDEEDWRCIIFSRMLTTDDPLDYQIDFDGPGIELIGGVNNNPGFGLDGLVPNFIENEATFVPWKDHDC